MWCNDCCLIMLQVLCELTQLTSLRLLGTQLKRPRHDYLLDAGQEDALAEADQVAAAASDRGLSTRTLV